MAAPITYTGPIPPPPTDAATWANWLAYQVMLQNVRYENEREAARVLAAERVIVTDRQHVEKMAAEAACALANTKLAEANQAMAAAIAEPQAGGTDIAAILKFALDFASVALNKQAQ